MIAPTPVFKGTLFLAALVCCLSPDTRADPLPGAFDNFPDQVNADAWRVYDYSDGEDYLPDWYEVTDPFIGLAHIDDSPLWFYAGADVAQGAFVGDYASTGILAIGVDFFVDNGFDFIDCAVFTQGPFGWSYYYSRTFFGDEYPGGGWQQEDFKFDENWFYWNSAESRFVPVQPDTTFLANIEQIGFRFFPVEGNTATTIAAIDYVAMVPVVTAPRLEPEVAGDQFKITFTPNPGTECDLLRFVPGLVDPWPAVAGQTGITGPAAHQYSTPLTPPSALFRVRAVENYFEVFTPSP